MTLKTQKLAYGRITVTKKTKIKNATFSLDSLKQAFIWIDKNYRIFVRQIMTQMFLVSFS